MGSKMKMAMGMALVLGILSIAFFAAPIQASFSRSVNGDMLQKQDQDRLRTQDCDCVCDCTETKYRSRQRTDQCATNRMCNCTMNLEQYRYQHREITKIQGN